MIRAKNSSKHSRKNAPNEAVSQLLSAFERDTAGGPPICAKALTAVIRDIHSGFSYRFMRPPYNKIWTPLLALILSPRDAGGMQELSNSLSQCACHIDLSRYHNRDVQTQLAPTNVIITPWSDLSDFERAAHWTFSLLWEACSTIGVKRTGKAESGDLWPNRPEDLLPGGAKATVESLIIWARFLNSLAPIGVFGYILDTCRELVFPAVKESTTVGPCFLEMPWTMCRTVIRRGNRDVLGLRMFAQQLPYLSKFYKVARWQAILFFLSLVNGKVVSLLQQMSLILHIFSQRGLLLKMYKNKTETEGMEGLMGFVHVGEHILMRFPQARLSRYQHYLIPTTEDMQSYWEEIQRNKENQTAISRGTPEHQQIPPKIFSMVYRVMVFAKQQNLCNNLNCTKSLVIGNSLRRCGRCQVTAYCSLECQRSSWTDPENPHKTVCKKMASLIEIGGGLKLSEEDFERKCELGGASKVDAFFIWLSSPMKAEHYPSLEVPSSMVTGEEDYERLLELLYEGNTARISHASEENYKNIRAA